MKPDEETSRAAEIFDQALALPQEQRPAFVDGACAGNCQLFHYVMRLLENSELPTGDVLPDLGTEAPPPLPDSVGRRYESIEFLGRGGMGVVYRARDRVLKTLVALKTLDPVYTRDQQMIERLKEEVRLGQEIAHKSICRIHGLDVFDGILLISMEYVEGETLRSTLNRTKGVSVPQGLSWAQEICDALEAAHDKQVIHRDLKPENIMIDREGHIKVMDFGIARSIKNSKPAIGTSIGTPDYMAPEQKCGGLIGPATDIYSLGLVLYELFTGSKRSQSDLPADEANPYLPGRIVRTISRCLEETPTRRFQAVNQVRMCLAGVSVSDGRGRRSRLVRAALGTLLAALLVCIFFFINQPPKAQHDGAVNALAFTSDGHLLASASEDKTVRIWEVPSMRNLQTLADHSRAVTTLAFSADGHWLASGSQDRKVKIWEVSTGRLFYTLSDNRGLVAVALSPDGRWLASTSSETAKVWDVRSGRVAHVLRNEDDVQALAFSGDGSLLASGGADETVWIWQVDTGRVVGGPLQHDDVVASVAFSPDGRFLASGTLDNVVKIWSLTTWMTIQTLSHQEAVAALRFTSDGRRLMSVTVDGRVTLWAAPTWNKVADFMADEHGAAQAWAFSPDGRRLAIGTNKGSIKLRSLPH
jgi:WD40 repeat protein